MKLKMMNSFLTVYRVYCNTAHCLVCCNLLLHQLKFILFFFSYLHFKEFTQQFSHQGYVAYMQKAVAFTLHCFFFPCHSNLFT